MVAQRVKRERTGKFGLAFFLFLCLVPLLGLPERGYPQKDEVSSFPTRPINFVIPLPPGSKTDLAARLVVKTAEKFLGQPIVPVNKPGAALTIGVAAIATAKPDGYTIGLGAHSPLLVAPLLEKVPYHPINDLRQIMQFMSLNFGIVVRSDSSYKSLKDIVAYARQNPKKLTYGTNARGLLDMIMKQIAIKEGVEFTLIPYTSTFEAETALLGGHIEVTPGDFNISLVEAGQTRLLVLLKEEHSADDPHVPILKELGYDIPCPFFNGIMGPKGLPEGIVKKLEDALTRATKDPGFVKGMNDLRLPTGYRTGKDLGDYVARNFEAYKKFLTERGVIK